MADVYGREVQLGGAISADGVRVTFDDFKVGFLAQTLGLNYQQQVTRLFELSSQRQYYVVGRPTGTLSISRVVGPVGLTRGFMRKFGNACNAAQNTINLAASAGCLTNIGGTTGNGIGYTATNVFITQMGLNVEAQSMLINEAFSMMFVGLHER